MLRPLCALVLLLVCQAGLAALEHVRFYEVSPSSPSAPIDVGEIASAAIPGDTIVVNCFANPPYVMVRSDPPVDPGQLGWSMIGLGVYRLVVPKGKAINTRHEVRFSGKLRKVEEGEGGTGTTPEVLIDWALKGTVVIVGKHEGLGRDDQRDPPAAIAVDKSHKEDGVRGPARLDATTETYTGSDGGRELGSYVGDVSTSRQLTGKELPPVKTDKCPQDREVDVQFVYIGVDEKELSVVVDPDRALVDTKPAFPDWVKGTLKTRLLERWDSIAAGTAVHEAGHREIAYKIADALAAMLDRLRVYGYAEGEARARQLAGIAWEEFSGHILGQVGDQLAKAQAAYDVTTDSGYKQQPKK